MVSPNQMPPVPRRPFSRVLAALWLLACLAILLVLLTHPGIHGDAKSPLKILVPLYFLSFPLGHAGVTACIEIKLALYLRGWPQPGILLEGLFLWTSLTLLGYAQWFLLLPWVSRRCRQLADFLMAGHRA